MKKQPSKINPMAAIEGAHTWIPIVDYRAVQASDRLRSLSKQKCGATDPVIIAKHLGADKVVKANLDKRIASLAIIDDDQDLLFAVNNHDTIHRQRVALAYQIGQYVFSLDKLREKGTVLSREQWLDIENDHLSWIFALNFLLPAGDLENRFAEGHGLLRLTIDMVVPSECIAAWAKRLNLSYRMV